MKGRHDGYAPTARAPDPVPSDQEETMTMSAHMTVRDVMTPQPVCCDAHATIGEAAQLMRDQGIGDVLVEQDGRLLGLVTDRDIVIRALAEGRDASTTLDSVCTEDPVTLEPDAPVQQAVELMRSMAIRRVPVVEKGRPVGIVSIGDLALELDERSALADISAAEPDV
jgi:CBS domain-containing protein